MNTKKSCHPRQVSNLLHQKQISMLYAKAKNRRTMHLDKSLDRCMLRIVKRLRPPPRYPVDSELGDQRGRKQSDPRP